MQPHDRYEIIEQIAEGDYATVHRALDKELGREVAIKQIHDQFLQDPKKLESYWQEAQLLAKLEHPYIMTIYDIVRDRGWLILELMQGSLPQKLAGNPVDLEDLRLSVIYMLHALSFLQKNGIIHGDVKPSNLLLDKNHRVKLGDFGIARRVSGDDGSVVKGTTKYMAPEVVSDQFGPVGPHSDLYSLGFSAYELMCGQHFETLFPGLNMYGRDQQIAWMMWHSALDRRLPDIHRVLQGVPDDLANVVQKLTEKDPGKRYKTAEEVLTELRTKDKGAEQQIADEIAEADSQQKSERRKRMTLIGALAVSLCLSIAMVFIPTESTPKEKPQGKVQIPNQGVIHEIDIRRRALAVRPGNGDPVPISFDENDKILLNRTEIAFEELRKGDHIKVSDGGDIKVIIVTRSKDVRVEMMLVGIDVRARMLKLASDPDATPELEVFIPNDIEIRLNGASSEISKLARGDRINVEHVEGKINREAKSVSALRLVSVEGFVESFSTGSEPELTLRVGTADGPAKTFAVAAACKVTLNGETDIEGRKLSLADLKAKDRVQIQRDSHVRSIDAFRSFRHDGIVKSVNTNGGWFEVAVGDPPQNVAFSLTPKCTIEGLPVASANQLKFIRPGDHVTIDHSSATLSSPQAYAIKVKPATNPRLWAIVIAQSEYVDAKLPQIERIARDAKRVHNALVGYYRVPPDQILLAENSIRLGLVNKLEEHLSKVSAATKSGLTNPQLLVYFGGHAMLDDEGTPLLLARDFDSGNPTGTGLKLRDLLGMMEKTPAGERVLLLDTCHQTGDAADAELPDALLQSSDRRVSASVVVVAGTSKGEMGKTLEGDGAFATVVANALKGEADKNGDAYISSGELFAFIGSDFRDRGLGQTPQQFLPDATPIRLTEDTRKAVEKVLVYLEVARIDEESLRLDYELAQRLQPKEPDADIAYGLVLLKDGRTRDAQRVFEKLRPDHPQRLIPSHALAWQYFMQKKHSQSIVTLASLVSHLPKPAEGEDYDAYSRHVLEFAGTLREFAVSALETQLTPDDTKPLDSAIINRGGTAEAYFRKGIDAVRATIKRLNEDFQKTTDPDKRAEIRRDLRRLSFYTKFNFVAAAAAARAALQQ